MKHADKTPIIMSQTFKDKIKIIEQLQNEVDEHIWKVFHTYIKDNQINFSDPERWDIQTDSIYFSGHDGCMGVYEHKGLRIPLEHFTQQNT